MYKRYEDFNVAGFTPTHDAVIFLLRQKHPELQHGTDYKVGMEIDGITGTQLSNAFIVDWSLPYSPPTTTELEQLAVQHMTAWNDILNPPAPTAKEQAAADLEASDAKMTRTVEDLIDALVVNGTVALSDLGPVSEARIAQRKADRAILISKL